MKLPTVGVSILILIAVLIPGSNIPDVGVTGVDKVVHLCMFAVWAVAVRYDFDRERFPYILVFVCGILFSALTEVLQLLVEDRTFDFYDMGADGIGIVLGLVISGWVVRWIRRRM